MNERLTSVLCVSLGFKFVFHKRHLIFPLSLSFTEPNWGLPLAIAANLHIPYRIEIGLENIDKANIEDVRGKGEKHFRFIFLSE